MDTLGEAFQKVKQKVKQKDELNSFMLNTSIDLIVDFISKNVIAKLNQHNIDTVNKLLDEWITINDIPTVDTGPYNGLHEIIRLFTVALTRFGHVVTPDKIRLLIKLLLISYIRDRNAQTQNPRSLEEIVVNLMGQLLKRQTAQEQHAQELAARELAAREVAARELAAREVAAREVAAREVAARELAAREVAARELAARELAARELAAQKSQLKDETYKAKKDYKIQQMTPENRAKYFEREALNKMDPEARSKYYAEKNAIRKKKYQENKRRIRRLTDRELARMLNQDFSDSILSEDRDRKREQRERDQDLSSDDLFELPSTEIDDILEMITDEAKKRHMSGTVDLTNVDMNLFLPADAESDLSFNPEIFNYHPLASDPQAAESDLDPFDFDPNSEYLGGKIKSFSLTIKRRYKNKKSIKRKKNKIKKRVTIKYKKTNKTK
jgi:hypothetical protein